MLNWKIYIYIYSVKPASSTRTTSIRHRKWLNAQIRWSSVMLAITSTIWMYSLLKTSFSFEDGFDATLKWLNSVIRGSLYAGMGRCIVYSIKPTLTSSMLSLCRRKCLNARIGPSSFIYTMVFYRKIFGFVRPLFGLFVERCARRNCRKDSNHRKVGGRRRRISWPSTPGSSLVEPGTIWSNSSRKDSETICWYMHKVHMTGLSFFSFSKDQQRIYGYEFEQQFFFTTCFGEHTHSRKNITDENKPINNYIDLITTRLSIWLTLHLSDLNSV